MITETTHSRTVTRAAEQAANYSFRRMTVKTSRGPVSIVYVYGGTETYQITEGTHHRRCSCKSYQKRHAGTLHGRCKHLVMLAAQEEAEAKEAALQASREAFRKQMGRDFPEW